jgi:hypothetical protein
VTDYERGFRAGVLAARDYLRWIWDDGEQGNCNDASELIMLTRYAERAPPDAQPRGEPE